MSVKLYKRAVAAPSDGAIFAAVSVKLNPSDFFALDEFDALADDLRKSIDDDLAASLIGSFASGLAGGQGAGGPTGHDVAGVEQARPGHGDGYQGEAHDPVGAQADAGSV